MIINKLKKFIGVEINDLDITKILDIGIINEISELLSEFSVVVIRDQNITNDQHIKFSECFGNLEQTKVGTDGSGSKLIILRNFDEDGNIVPPTDRQRLNNLANKEWHSDSSFKKIPSKLSILSAKMIPSNGGDTEFLSMRAAYNSLPENLKLNIEDKVCWHDYSHGRLKIDPNLVTSEEKKALPPVKQKLVLNNKKYGKSLYLGAHCSKIDGMTENESQNLLKEIYEFVDNKSFVYSHIWKPYDLIMWDNRSVLHRATPIKGKIEKRLMVRTTIAGETSTLND
ncbi:MAG: TauD/TfdA dioxygenase family protein [Candidatus Puniceispirillales bacterium]|jgi:alpha-ketoglutarate-dependent 2,4-dichlorophenoxyacetate dioxygenase|tara:strand:+ start:253 stop:1104 length:852 start_codon:yes stop_codon:yes gene_type:complete